MLVPVWCCCCCCWCWLLLVLLLRHKPSSCRCVSTNTAGAGASEEEECELNRNSFFCFWCWCRPAVARFRGEVLQVRRIGRRRGGRRRRRRSRWSRPGLKGSIGEGPNHSNFSDESTVNIVSEFRKFQILLKFIRNPKISRIMFNIF